ncbi:glycoside hydrolase, family 3, N-terminal domain protein [Leptospira broomii serovar Hurstbridge str. 5399]|uniref:beta-N-acetylhexosaminidase n=2 Tax=Leptospira broomii TaxID=301541 RepID=T0GK11_9LEPT|nr:glycoside hydrolase, family 3, N-terminal domain protein [Leptospira broomii serovar Hurstbridge str. 5399]
MLYGYQVGYELGFMIKRILLAVVFAGLFLVSLQWLGQYRAELQAQEIQEGMLRQADEIVNKLSPQELVGQVIHVAIPGTTLDSVAETELEAILPGGVILFGRNLGNREEITTLNDSLQKKALKLTGLPLLISVDQEGGRVIRVRDGVTQFPGAMALGQTKDSEYAKKVGFVTSYQLRKLGLNFLFAPDLDINNNPDNPVINTRSLGSNLETVLSAGVAYEEGARLGGAIPVIKHFPGHGDTNVDSHLGLPKIEKNLEELRSLELVPFKAAIDNGAEAVMSAHILYPKIDSDFPATLSSRILTDLLRKELKFKGIVITDAMEMDAIDEHYQAYDPGVLALLAGADIILMTSWGKTTQDMKEKILKAYKKGTLHRDGKDVLKEAAKRQILLKLKHGIVWDFSKKQKEGRAKDILTEDISETLRKYYEDQATHRESLNVNWNLPELNRDVSRKSIVSYPNSYNPATVPLSETLFAAKGSEFSAELAARSLQNLNFSQVSAAIEKRKGKRVILTGAAQVDLDMAGSLAKKFPKVEIVVLHYGTPFLHLPELPNLKILFSFSPTNESKKALLYSILDRKEEIPKVDLVLKNGTKEKEIKAAPGTP